MEKQIDYLSKLELKSNLKIQNRIEKILIIKKKYFIVKSLNEISVYLIDSNKMKFKIPLKETNDKKYYYNYNFIFDFNYKLRLLDNKDNKTEYKLLTDKYLIEANFNKNKWKIISELERGIYIYNLDIIILDKGFICIKDKKGKIKQKIKSLHEVIYGLYEIKDKYLILNTVESFRIFNINNYEILYLKENCIYSHGYKHPFILNDQTLVFSSLLNPYIEGSEKYIFVDLNNLSERYVENISYNFDDYDSTNKLFIIHKFTENIYLQCEVVEDTREKRWSIVKEKNNRLSFIKKLDDKKLFGNNIYFLSDNLIITWNFLGTTIKFIYYN